jgi:8-oxo-dGTP pyrophosphatase MutT (NUDIX family)
MNKKKSEEAVIFVAGILERVEGNTKKIFIQTRWKPNISPIYSGLLEVPGGRVDSHENVFDAIIREVKEECGLDVKAFRSSFRGESFSVDKFEETVLFQPFVCQQVLNKNDGRLWFGFFFICEVVGEA